MNTEELKMVLDAISSLGANGKEAFIWWLVLKHGTNLVIGLMLTTVAITVPYLIVRTISKTNERSKAIAEIGRVLGVDYYDWSDYTPPGHGLNDVMDAFRKKMNG